MEIVDYFMALSLFLAITTSWKVAVYMTAGICFSIKKNKLWTDLNEFQKMLIMGHGTAH